MNSKNLTQTLLRLFSVIVLIIFFNVELAAQKVNINFKNTPLKSVINEVSRQTGYNFVYSDALTAINDSISISYTSNGKPIEKLLDLLFPPKGISYKIENKQVILAPKSIVPVQSRDSDGRLAPVQQPKLEIRGVIVDDTGMPLPGVTVLNISRGSATFADNDGRYSMRDIQVGDVLRFVSIGMVTREIRVSGNTSVYNIEMESDNITLSDVVVTGYQTISKERATGSFNIIKAEQLDKPTTNLGQRLIGTTAGVQSKLDANGNVTFEIRGQTSLMAVAQPLIVVDGFAIQGDLNSINPNDVENVTILKDAAATSIWGARSANGVIVVTTKSGAASKAKGVKIDFNSFLKYSPKIDIYYQNPYASSEEVIDYEKRGFSTNFFGGPWAPIPNSNTSLTGSYSAAVLAMNEHRLGFLSTQELEATLADLGRKDNREQIKDFMLQNPFTRQYNLSVSSSNDRITNVFSLMYEGGDENYKGNDYRKYMVNLRSKVNVFKWLDFSFTGSFVVNNKDRNGSVYSGTPYQMLVNEDGSRTNVPNTFYWPNIERHVPYNSFTYNDWSYNPITETESRDFTTTTLNARIQGGLTFKIIKGLTFDSRFQYEMLNNENREHYYKSSFTVRQTVNTTSSWDRTNNKVTANLPAGGFLDQDRDYTNAYNWRNQINFNRDFNERHKVSFIAGTEISDRVFRSVTNPRTYGYDDERLTVGTFPNGVGGSGVYKLTNWTGANQTFSYTNRFTYSTDRYFSMYANASYTFDDKYTLSGSARTDASNLITDDPKYRFSPFWSVGASWVLSKESFMQSYEWIDRLNVRLTYGFNGNVDKSTSFMPLISVTGTQNSYIQDYTASISSFGNPSLRWEKTGTIDLGVDFDLFKGKLFGKLDIYNKKGKDLIVSMSIPAVNGTNSQKLNMAEMTNRGFEMELGTVQRLFGSDVVWTGNMNFAYNKNVIDKLFKATYSASNLYGGGTAAYVQGYDANTLWAFEYAGVVNKGTDAAPNWQPVVQGKGEDLYDFTGWTPGDGRDYMLDMGTKVAPYSLGVSSSFKFHDFDFSFIVTGKFGHVFNGFNFNYPSMSGGSALPNRLYAEILNSDPMERVPIPFDKSEPRYYFWDRFYPYLNYRVQNANHVRVQEINLTYNMPRTFLNKIGINSAKVYAQANNLLTLTNNRYNEDPEFPLGSLKPQSALIFGINLSF